MSSAENETLREIASVFSAKCSSYPSPSHLPHIVLHFWLSKLFKFSSLAPVVRKVDNAIHRINHYPVDSVVCFVNTYPLDSDLSGG